MVMDMNSYFSSWGTSNMYISRLDYSNFNIDAFNEKYRIVGLTYSDDKSYFNFGSTIFDELTEVVNVLSVSYIQGKTVFMLLEKDAEFDWNYLREKEEYEKLSMEEFTLSEADKVKVNTTEVTKGKTISMLDAALNLMLGGLSRRKRVCSLETGEEISCESNVNGKLHIYAGATTRGKGKEPTQFATMVYTAKAGVFARSTVSFHKLTKYNKDYFKGKPKYYIESGENNSKVVLKPYLHKEIKDKALYVRASNKKSSILYDNRYVARDHKKTRTEILHQLLDDFEMEYGDIWTIEFRKYPVWTKPIEKGYDDKVKEEIRKEFRSLGPVNLVIAEDVRADYGDENLEMVDSNVNLKVFISFLEELAESVEISDVFNPEKVNIAVIHDKEYYERTKKEDVKKKIPKDIICQSVTIENIEENLKDLNHIAAKLLSELIIKAGLKKQTFENWTFGKCKIYLGIRDKINLGPEPEHCLMTVDDDGHFEIEDDPEKIGAFYTNFISSEDFEKKDSYKNGNICIVEKDGNVNGIMHTDLVPIIDKSGKEELDDLSRKTNKTRTIKEEYRTNKELYPYVGKIAFLMDDCLLYSIGSHDGPRPEVGTVNNIYRVTCYDNENGQPSDFIPEILDLTKNYFVRSNNTESVRPYPYKYLMEHLRIKTQATGIRLA